MKGNERTRDFYVFSFYDWQVSFYTSQFDNFFYFKNKNFSKIKRKFSLQPGNIGGAPQNLLLKNK